MPILRNVQDVIDAANQAAFDPFSVRNFQEEITQQIADGAATAQEIADAVLDETSGVDSNVRNSLAAEAAVELLVQAVILGNIGGLTPTEISVTAGNPRILAAVVAAAGGSAELAAAALNNATPAAERQALAVEATLALLVLADVQANRAALTAVHIDLIANVAAIQNALLADALNNATPAAERQALAVEATLAPLVLADVQANRAALTAVHIDLIANVAAIRNALLADALNNATPAAERQALAAEATLAPLVLADVQGNRAALTAVHIDLIANVAAIRNALLADALNNATPAAERQALAAEATLAPLVLADVQGNRAALTAVHIDLIANVAAIRNALLADALNNATPVAERRALAVEATLAPLVLADVQGNRAALTAVHIDLIANVAAIRNALLADALNNATPAAERQALAAEATLAPLVLGDVQGNRAALTAVHIDLIANVAAIRNALLADALNNATPAAERRALAVEATLAPLVLADVQGNRAALTAVHIDLIANVAAIRNALLADALNNATPAAERQALAAEATLAPLVLGDVQGNRAALTAVHIDLIANVAAIRNALLADALNNATPAAERQALAAEATLAPLVLGDVQGNRAALTAVHIDLIANVAAIRNALLADALNNATPAAERRALAVEATLAPLVLADVQGNRAALTAVHIDLIANVAAIRNALLADALNNATPAAERQALAAEATLAPLVLGDVQGNRAALTAVHIDLIANVAAIRNALLADALNNATPAAERQALAAEATLAPLVLADVQGNRAALTAVHIDLIANVAAIRNALLADALNNATPAAERQALAAEATLAPLVLGDVQGNRAALTAVHIDLIANVAAIRNALLADALNNATPAAERQALAAEATLAPLVLADVQGNRAALTAVHIDLIANVAAIRNALLADALNNATPVAERRALAVEATLAPLVLADILANAAGLTAVHTDLIDHVPSIARAVFNASRNPLNAGNPGIVALGAIPAVAAQGQVAALQNVGAALGAKSATLDAGGAAVNMQFGYGKVSVPIATTEEQAVKIIIADKDQARRTGRKK
jgi:hypothetical protein